MFKHVEVAGFFVRAFAVMILLITIAVATPVKSAPIEREIAWTEDYESAIQRAASTNSVILLHFYGDYCPPCKLLDKKTFHDPALVSSMNEHLVTIKVNADRRRDLAQKFQVTRWPTDVYLFPNGDEIYRGVSNADPAVYCKTIERVALRHRDWTVERNSIAKAKEKRQDRALAAHTPQIQQMPQVHSGSAGRPVRTQDASWGKSEGQTQSAQPAGHLLVHTNSRVIENPFMADPPVMVPTRTQPHAAPIVNATRTAPPTSTVEATPKTIIATHVPGQHTNAPPEMSPQQSHANVGTASQVATSQPIEQQHIYAETIGLGGFCPVTLIESLSQPNAKGWVEGKKSFAVRHRGRVYYCASENARQTLLSDPDRYTPCLSGFDIVQFCKDGVLRDGKCEFGCIQEGKNRIFLFDNKANYDTFAQNSAHYSNLLDSSEPERIANESNGTQIR